MLNPLENFFKNLQHSLSQKSLVRLHLLHYVGDENELKKIIITPVVIKKKNKLSFVSRYKTRDITKNYTPAEALTLLADLLSPHQFKQAILFTTQHDLELKLLKNNHWQIKKSKASFDSAPSVEHDKTKRRKIKAEGKTYLHELKITDINGNVRPHGQDKFKQINHYIEILSSLLNELPKSDQLNIVDMGSGKGYLTFALYDYLNNEQHKKAAIQGIEYRKDLVDLCNKIAQKSSFEHLSFKQGTIDEFQPNQEQNVLIALHACDTATDDAIYKGIVADANLIVVAPCCHKQIRKEIQNNKQDNELNFLTKHGIFMERQAEMVTDSLRALYLEQAGYATKIFEFIATEHTPKNILIVGQKRKNNTNNGSALAQKIEETKKYFGIKKHHLEELMKA